MYKGGKYRSFGSFAKYVRQRTFAAGEFSELLECDRGSVRCRGKASPEQVLGSLWTSLGMGRACANVPGARGAARPTAGTPRGVS